MIDVQEILKGIRPYVLSWIDRYQGPWTDYSAASTIVGWSSFTTQKIQYKTVGKLVFVQFYLSGTSNSTSTTFTLPYTQITTGNPLSLIINTYNAGANALSLMELASGGNTVNCYSTPAGAAWTASGVKYVAGQFWYIAA